MTFDIDANGILKVSAKDLDTMKEQSITITANDRMTDAEIEQAIYDAQQYAGQDELRREALELSQESYRLLARVQQAVKDAGKQIDKAEKKQLKSDCHELEKKLTKLRVDKVTAGDIQGLRMAKVQLESSSVRLLNEQNMNG